MKKLVEIENNTIYRLDELVAADTDKVEAIMLKWGGFKGKLRRYMSKPRHPINVRDTLTNHAKYADGAIVEAVLRGFYVVGPLDKEDINDDSTYLDAITIGNLAYVALHSTHVDESKIALDIYIKFIAILLDKAKLDNKFVGLI